MAELKSQWCEPAVPDSNETRYQAQLRERAGTRGCRSVLQYIRWQRTQELALICWQARGKRQRMTGEKGSWTYSCSSRGTPVPWTGTQTDYAVRACSSDAQGASCSCILNAKAISLWKKPTCLLQPLLGAEEFLITPTKTSSGQDNPSGQAVLCL